MLFHRSFSQKLAKEVEMFIRDKPFTYLLSVRDNNVKGLAETFYDSYSKLRTDVEDRVVLRKKLINYDLDLKKAKEYIENYDWSILKSGRERAGYYQAPTHRFPWVSVGIGEPKKIERYKRRIYVNTKIGKLHLFVRQLIEIMFAFKYFTCHNCHRQNVGFQPSPPKFSCSNCGTKSTLGFSFKFHKPDRSKNPPRRLLRYDKVIMYFSNEFSYIVMVLLLESMSNHLFDPYTPHFTHKIRPGVGSSNEPTTQETEDYNRATKEGNTLISAGQYLSGKVAEILLNEIRKNPSIITILNAIDTSKIGGDRKKWERDFLHIINPIIRRLPPLFEADKSLHEWSDRLNSVNKYLSVA